MWPHEDDEDDRDGVLDEDEIVARIEAAFREERARIRAATHPGALRSLSATYVEQVADGVLEGFAALRARDLVELIDERLAELEAATLRRQRAHAKQRERPDPEPGRRAGDEHPSQSGRAATREPRESLWRAEADERAAAARRANAEAAEIEARAALLRAQAARTTRASARPVVTSAPVAVSQRPRPSPLERAIAEPVQTDATEAGTRIKQMDREALMAAGRWPPMGPSRDSIFWTPDADWPREWTLKGFDLATFRGRLGVTQAVLAGQLGVETVEISRAEAKARDKVRPALQVALKRALDEFRAANPPPTLATASIEAPSNIEPASSAPPPALTGADLGRFREAQGLTQRQAAEWLGVAHGTVAKAELLPAHPLGERLQQALRDALRG